MRRKREQVNSIGTFQNLKECEMNVNGYWDDNIDVYISKNAYFMEPINLCRILMLNNDQANNMCPKFWVIPYH